MSSALARKRRAAGEIPAPNPGMAYNPNINVAPPAPKPNGLTLPQVIAVIDNRLIALESFVKEQKQSGPSSSEKSVTFALENENDAENDVGVTNDFMEEMQSRYEILAREIVDLKDIVLKLQSYTMDVNKTLLEERIHILSDLGDRSPVVDTAMSSEEM